MTLAEASERVGVTPATLRRWTRSGLIPQHDGEWSPAAIGQARVVAKMRERGHTLREIRRATEEGRLAFGFLEDLFPSDRKRFTLEQAARETGIEPSLIERVVGGLGIPPASAPASPRTSCSCCATSPLRLARAFRSWRCSSWCASMARRWRAWPTPRCACSTSTFTSP